MDSRDSTSPIVAAFSLSEWARLVAYKGAVSAGLYSEWEPPGHRLTVRRVDGSWPNEVDRPPTADDAGGPASGDTLD